MPKRSQSYTGPVRPPISSSQPLQEPASTSRIASARPRSRRVPASTSPPSSTASLSPGGRGSVARPTFRILEKSDTSAPPPLALELSQHTLAPGELVAEDPSRDLEEIAHQGVAERVADGDSLLARR